MLQISVFKEGIARLATVKYEPVSKKNMKVRNMHLTNYAINKHSEGFNSDEASDKVASGTGCPISVGKCAKMSVTHMPASNIA